MTKGKLYIPLIRHNITGISKADAGQGPTKNDPVDGVTVARCRRDRQTRMNEWKSVVPNLLAGRSNVDRYDRCLGETCRLHFVCEHCWFNTITMPLFRSFCGDGFTPTGRNENLYLVTLNGINGGTVDDLNTARVVTQTGQRFFADLMARPVFHVGGVVSGVSAYHYVYRYPNDHDSDRRTVDRWVDSSSPYAPTIGWSIKVVLLVRSTLNLSTAALQRYLTCCLDWVKDYDADRGTNTKLLWDAFAQTTARPYYKPASAGGVRLSMQVRKMKSVEDAIHRYSCGQLNPKEKVTTTSAGGKLKRPLRLPLLDCSSAEAARLLDWAYTPLAGKKTVRHIHMTGDFLKHERPSSLWMTLMGGLREPGVTNHTLSAAGLTGPPMTTEANVRFEKWVRKLSQKACDNLADQLIFHGTCSELSADSKLRPAKKP